MHQPGIEIPCVQVTKSVTELNEGVPDNSDSCKTFFLSSMMAKAVAVQSCKKYQILTRSMITGNVVTVREDWDGDWSNSDVTASNSDRPNDRTLRREMAL
jgi:hypothetical protein